MKNILYTAILIFACIPLKAQLRIHSNFGIKAGAQAAKLGQPGTNWDSKYRWHAGLLAHVHISRHFAIQPELIYSAQGAEHITTVTDTQIELDYLNLPIVFQYMTNFGLRFQAGPQIGILLNAKENFNSAESDIMNSIKKADVGVLAGFSYLTKVGLGIDARYVYGLTDIAKKGNGAGLGSDLNNLVIQAGVFYQFK
jgi:hypothetical protein